MARTGFEPPTIRQTRSVVLHTMTTVWLLHEKLLRLIKLKLKIKNPALTFLS